MALKYYIEFILQKSYNIKIEKGMEMNVFEAAKFYGDWTEVFKLLEQELSENNEAVSVP